MTKIVRAHKSFMWKNFWIKAGTRMLLDDVHLDGEVFLPGMGMINIPFKTWIRWGSLVDEGESSIEMKIHNGSLIGIGHQAESSLEPMFHHIWLHLENLSPYAKGLRGAEVGVFEGANAEKILRVLPIEKLYLIDDYGSGSYQHGNPDLSAARKLAHKRLEPWKDKIEWMEMASEKALWLLRGQEFEFCYHDSDHRRPCVERELPLGYATVQQGGVWGGHDYKNTHEGECEVKSCVDEFFIDHKLSPLWYSPEMLNWWHVKG